MPRTLVADKGVPSGVKSYDVSLDTQTATVHTEPFLGYRTVLQTIKKTGKTVISGKADGEEKPVELEELDI
jgi:copper chaperone